MAIIELPDDDAEQAIEILSQRAQQILAKAQRDNELHKKWAIAEAAAEKALTEYETAKVTTADAVATPAANVRAVVAAYNANPKSQEAYKQAREALDASWRQLDEPLKAQAKAEREAKKTAEAAEWDATAAALRVATTPAEKKAILDKFYGRA